MSFTIENNFKHHFNKIDQSLYSVSSDLVQNEDTLKAYRIFISRISKNKVIRDVKLAIVYFSYLKSKGVDINNLEELYLFHDENMPNLYQNFRDFDYEKLALLSKNDLIVSVNHKFLELINLDEFSNYVGMTIGTIKKYRNSIFDILIVFCLVKYLQQVHNLEVNALDILIINKAT